MAQAAVAVADPVAVVAALVAVVAAPAAALVAVGAAARAVARRAADGTDAGAAVSAADRVPIAVRGAISSRT